jgi:hypothetical protein
VSTTVRLSLFFAGLVVAFVLGLGLGTAVGPFGDDPPAPHQEMPSHG